MLCSDDDFCSMDLYAHMHMRPGVGVVNMSFYSFVVLASQLHSLIIPHLCDKKL